MWGLVAKLPWWCDFLKQIKVIVRAALSEDSVLRFQREYSVCMTMFAVFFIHDQIQIISVTINFKLRQISYFIVTSKF